MLTFFKLSFALSDDEVSTAGQTLTKMKQVGNPRTYKSLISYVFHDHLYAHTQVQWLANNFMAAFTLKPYGRKPKRGAASDSRWIRSLGVSLGLFYGVCYSLYRELYYIKACIFITVKCGMILCHVPL